MMSSQRDPRLFGFVGLALLALTRIGLAQVQPPVAVNNQDEEIQFWREIEKNTDEFRILRSGDKEELNRYVTEVFELEEAVAFELLPHLLAAVRPERGNARPLKYKDPATGETRYFLQVVCPEFQLPYIRSLLETLDLPGVESVQGNIYYHVRMAHRDASEVGAAIDGTVLSPEGFFHADDVTNTLYIFDSVSDGERDIETIKFYDVPPPQVEIAVWVIEIGVDDDATLGLDWEAWKRSLAGGLTLTQRQNVHGSAPDGVGNFTASDVVLSIGGDALASFVNYLVDNGKAKIMTETTLSALNHKPATLGALKRVPIFGRTPDVQGFSGLTDVSANEPGVAPVFVQGSSGFGGSARPGSGAVDPGDPALRLAEKSEGVFLSIFPSIFTESITLEVALTVNSLVGYTKIDAPIIAERRTHTTVNVVEGQTIKLGSMEKTTLVNDDSAIPVLGRIPGLRHLFGKSRETERRSKLIVFLSPTIKNNAIYSGKEMNNISVMADYPPIAGAATLAPNPNAAAPAVDLSLLDAMLRETETQAGGE